jgi:hypothetical protein
MATESTADTSLNTDIRLIFIFNKHKGLVNNENENLSTGKIYKDKSNKNVQNGCQITTKCHFYGSNKKAATNTIDYQIKSNPIKNAALTRWKSCIITKMCC